MTIQGVAKNSCVPGYSRSRSCRPTYRSQYDYHPAAGSQHRSACGVLALQNEALLGSNGVLEDNDVGTRGPNGNSGYFRGVLSLPVDEPSLHCDGYSMGAVIRSQF